LNRIQAKVPKSTNRASSYHHHHHELEGPLQNAYFYASSRSTFRLNFHFQSGTRIFHSNEGAQLSFLNAELCSGPHYNGIFAGASNPFIWIFLSCPYLCNGYFVFFFRVLLDRPPYLLLRPRYDGWIDSS